jgi:hypothetical protein
MPLCALILVHLSLVRSPVVAAAAAATAAVFDEEL